MIAISPGATDVTIEVFIPDSASATGAGKTGLAYNSSGLTAYYVRSKSSALSISLVTQTVTGNHADGGFVEIDAINMPGLYRFDLPDAVCAVGVSDAIVYIQGASEMAPTMIRLWLTYLAVNVVSSDNIDFTTLQKTSLNAATPASIQNIPATGSGFTALGDTRLANLDGKITDIPAGVRTNLATELGRIDAAISTRTKPADTQARVTLVDTTTLNSDMRGTDGALTTLGTLVADVATAVWGATTRTLSAFGFSLGFATPQNVTDAQTHIEGVISTVDGNVDSILADTNELQTDWANGGRLDLLLDSAGGDTIGVNAVTITVNDGTNPIPDVRVYIYDSTNVFLSTVQTTLIDGSVVVYLDNGEYKVRLRKTGVEFTNPESLTVLGTTTKTCTGTVIAVGLPYDPGDDDMTDVPYNFTTVKVPLSISQGTTFRKRWRFRFGTTSEPFPFFDSQGILLWSGRCMFRSAFTDTVPKVSLTNAGGGVTIDYVDDPDTGIRSVFYGLYLTAAQTALLPAGKVVYDIEFERLTDGWVIRPQKGQVTVDAEVTK